MNIANIHAIRESIHALRTLVQLGSSEVDFNWHTRVEETKWLAHLRLILSAAVRGATAIQTGQTVIVHCSDGWDRTGQVSALCNCLSLKGFNTCVVVVCSSSTLARCPLPNTHGVYATD